MIVLALVETPVLVTVGSREQRFAHEVGIARTWRNCNEPLVLTFARVKASVRKDKNLRVERSQWSVADHGPFRKHNDHSCLRILELTMRARRANVTWCALTWRRRLCRQLRGSKQPDLLPPHTFVIPLVRRFFVRFLGGHIHCVVREAGCAKLCWIHDAERVSRLEIFCFRGCFVSSSGGALFGSLFFNVLRFWKRRSSCRQHFCACALLSPFH